MIGCLGGEARSSAVVLNPRKVGVRSCLFLLTILSLVVPMSAWGEYLVLFVGNSFTDHSDNAEVTASVPDIFYALTQAGGHSDITVGSRAVGGKDFKWHSQDSGTQAAIGSQPWTHVILQNYSTEPTHATSVGGNVPDHMQYGGELYGMVMANPGTHLVILFETWSRAAAHPLITGTSTSSSFESTAQFQTELRTNYANLANVLNASNPAKPLVMVAPVGSSWEAAGGFLPSSDAEFADLFMSDDYHGNDNGCYLAAAVFYARVLGQSPVGLHTGQAVSDLGLNLTVSPELLESTAWATVLAQPAQPVAVVESPKDETVLIAEPVTFRSLVEGSPPYNVQWMRNGLPIPGAHDLMYTLPSAGVGDNGAVFSLVVSNGFSSATSMGAVLTVTGSNSNTPPVFETTPADSGILEMTLLRTTNSALDVDVPAQVLDYSLLVGPANATIDTNGVISWTPTEAQGPSTNAFVTVVTDGLASATNSFVVTVFEVNVPPVAESQSLAVLEDMETSIVLVGTDADLPANSLTYALVSAPIHGMLTELDANGGSVVYTPDPNYNGPDGFSFSAFDGVEASTGSVSIAVLPVDDPPAAAGVSLTVLEDHSTNTVLGASDIDSTYEYAEVLPVVAASSPDQWMLGTGSDKVQAVAVDDGDGSYIESGKSFNLQQQFALADATSIRPKDTITSVALRAVCTRTTRNTDYQLSGVLGGVVQSSPVFTAKNNYMEDSDRFESRPGGGPWTLADVQNLEVRILSLDSFVVRCTKLDAFVNYQSDLNTTNIVFSILDPPTNGILGSLNPVSGEVSYIPEADYSGPDAFTYTATIDSVVSTGLVTIEVLPLNDAPVFVAEPADITVEAMKLLSVTNRAVDVDLPAQVLTYTLLEAPANAVIDDGGVITWLPPEEYRGTTNVFTTEVSDGQAAATNSFMVTVTQSHASPVILSVQGVNTTNVVVTWSAISNVVYRLRYRTLLTEGDWIALAPDVLATNTTASGIDSATRESQRYYQVIIPSGTP